MAGVGRPCREMDLAGNGPRRRAVDPQMDNGQSSSSREAREPTRVPAQERARDAAGDDAQWEGVARSALEADRAGTLARIRDLGHDVEGMIEAARDVSTDDEHDPDGSTIAFERAQATALLAQEREHLADLDRADERLQDGSYGRCERCGAPIGRARLEARPTARTCIACASVRR